MADRTKKDPSPLKAGVLHGVLSLAVFGSVGALAGGVIHLAGNPDAAGPTYVVSLFETETADITTLRRRNLGGNSPQLASLTSPDELSVADGTPSEPNLGVADPGSVSTVVAAPAAPPQSQGIRINGKLVNPGQSLSDFEKQGGATVKPASIQTAKTTDTSQSTLANTRPFTNPENKPMVSLIIGGLGTSYSQTISAIDGLPPEITLSFVPDAQSRLLRYAREKGHEVLIEVPMEASIQGRARPHRDMLMANLDGDQNVLRLKSILRGKSEIFGVITDKGDKFASNLDAGGPMLEHLKERNLAFYQHSALQNANFEESAGTKGAAFAKAELNIDTEQRVSAINEQLFMLETAAREKGAALGTGFSFPVTVDTIARWSYELREKGIVLAPASAYAAEMAKKQTFQTSQVDLESSTLP